MPEPKPKRYRQPSPLSLHSLTNDYVRVRVAGGWSPTTAPSVSSGLHAFASTVHGLPPAKVTRRDIERFLAAPGLAVATRRHRLSYLRGFWRWLVLEGHVKSDPTIGVLPPRQPRRLPRQIGGEAVSRVLGVCPDSRGRLIVLLGAQEALRCIEMSRLRLEDIDFDRRSVLVTGKGSHERVIPVSDETWVELSRYLDEHPAQAGPLVRSYVNDCSETRWDWSSPVSSDRALTSNHISKLVSRWMWAAGVKGAAGDGRSAHALRHQAAGDMLRRGVNVRDLQAALGHTSLAVTSVYLPLVVAGLREAMGGRHYGGLGTRSTPQIEELATT